MKENIKLKNNQRKNECENELDENLITEINDIVINVLSDGRIMKVIIMIMENVIWE